MDVLSLPGLEARFTPHKTTVFTVPAQCLLVYFIFGRASNLYLCLYNQLFALFYYVLKFLTP